MECKDCSGGGVIDGDTCSTCLGEGAICEECRKPTSECECDEEEEDLEEDDGALDLSNDD